MSPALHVLSSPEASKDGVILINAADVPLRPVEWVWPGWLARGKLHLLAGLAGQGKTTIALSIVANVTTGKCWPDGEGCLAGNVIIYSGEDSLEDTLKPRLVAAGADCSRVRFVGGITIDGKGRSFDPSIDLDKLIEAAQALGDVALIVIDPLVSAIRGDSHKNAETRRDLQPVVELAEKLGAAVLGITHFSKGGQGNDPTLRVIGSVAFAAVARLVMIVSPFNANDGVRSRVLMRSKSNIGPDDGGFLYTLEQIEVAPGVNASCVKWGEQVTGTASELLAEGMSSSPSTSALAKACEFLLALLANGPILANDVFDAAIKAGHAEMTLRRASDELGIQKQKVDGRSQWSLQ